MGGGPTADRERSACLTYFGVNGEGCWREWAFLLVASGSQSCVQSVDAMQIAENDIFQAMQ